MKFLKRNVFIALKKLQYFFLIPTQNRFTHKHVPYFAQWESKNLVDKILKRDISAEDDPNWKQSGAKTKKEYLYWTWNLCGTACLKMILEYKTGKKYKSVELAKQLEAYGGYIKNELAFSTDEYGKAYAGLFYEPVVKYLTDAFGMRAKVVAPLIIEEIIYALDKGSFVIASVSPLIRNPKEKPKKTGGHLVLILGYDLKRKILYFHNPSGLYKKSQEYFEISFRNFRNFFDYKGIIIIK